MKPAFIVLPMFLTALPVLAANWVNVGESSSAVIFQDTHSIRIDGEKRRVWELSDRKVNGSNGSRSNRTLVEYDCKEARVRLLQATNFRGQGATGEIISMSSEPQPWSYIEPDTMGSLTLQAVCKFVP